MARYSAAQIDSWVKDLRPDQAALARSTILSSRGSATFYSSGPRANKGTLKHPQNRELVSAFMEKYAGKTALGTNWPLVSTLTQAQRVPVTPTPVTTTTAPVVTTPTVAPANNKGKGTIVVLIIVAVAIVLVCCCIVIIVPGYISFGLPTMGGITTLPTQFVPPTALP